VVREERRGKPERIGEKKGRGLTYGVGIDRRCPRWCKAPTSDFSISAMSQVEKEKGGAGGVHGAFIGGLVLEEKLGFAQIDRRLGEVACRGWSPARGR
jgi:hypothetical protein